MEKKILSICGEKLNMVYIDDIESLQEKIDNLLVVSKLIGYSIRSERVLLGRVYYLTCRNSDSSLKYSISFYLNDDGYVELIEVIEFSNLDKFQSDNMGEFLDKIDEITVHI